MKGVSFMKGYSIDLRGLPDEEKILNLINKLADEVFLVANKPGCYTVMWDLQESISSLIPDLPASRISESL